MTIDGTILAVIDKEIVSETEETNFEVAMTVEWITEIITIEMIGGKREMIFEVGMTGGILEDEIMDLIEMAAIEVTIITTVIEPLVEVIIIIEEVGLTIDEVGLTIDEVGLTIDEVGSTIDEMVVDEMVEDMAKPIGLDSLY